MTSPVRLPPKVKRSPRGQRLAFRRRRTKRLTRHERLQRIERHLHKAALANRGLTPKQLARYEKLSVARTRYYLRLLNERLRKQTLGIVSIKKIRKGRTIRFLYYRKPEPEPIRQIAPQQANVVVRISPTQPAGEGFEYEAVEHPSSKNIRIVGWILVAATSRFDRQVIAAQDRLHDVIERVLGQNLASMADVGLVARPEEVRKYIQTGRSNYLAYKHPNDPKWTQIEI